jgi:DNA-binding NarL/FixJ family response regulator
MHMLKKTPGIRVYSNLETKAAKHKEMVQSRKIRALLADEDAGFLESIRSFLEPQFDVIGCVDNGESLVEAAQKLQPDIIVTDVAIPKLSGIKAANRLRESGCLSKVIFLTIHTDPDVVRIALNTGALGYVLKNSATRDLLIAIQEALARRIFVSP